MAHDGENTVLTILGMKGSGKSTLAREIVGEYERVLILDAYGEYDDLPGAVVVEGGKRVADELILRQGEKSWAIVAILPSQQEALDVLAVAFEVPDHLIVLEEASLYCSPHEFPDELSMLVRYGRKREISLLVIARRPSEIARELTAQSDLLVTFRQNEPIDLQYLRARMGEEALDAQALPPFRVLVAGDRAKAPLAVLSRLAPRNQLTLFREEGDPTG